MEALVENAAWWGLCGAFIYAGPQLGVCLVASKKSGSPSWVCFFEFTVTMICGAIAAAAFSEFIADWAHLKNSNAIAAAIGWFVIPIAPRLTKRIAEIAEQRIASKLTGTTQNES